MPMIGMLQATIEVVVFVSISDLVAGICSALAREH